ncbi:hypothetical protein EYF80_030131 [Liparis tanakae]|uniref:Uncharacterized protein n=1 Tax=Liparis tanakae TaxID=230148 RepID=A0A4Z2H2V5_9TELE|nr:hypothetical protein EYF80_030131 [Liparis tanakae]
MIATPPYTFLLSPTPSYDVLHHPTPAYTVDNNWDFNAHNPHRLLSSPPPARRRSHPFLGGVDTRLARFPRDIRTQRFSDLHSDAADSPQPVFLNLIMYHKGRAVKVDRGSGVSERGRGGGGGKKDSLDGTEYGRVKGHQEEEGEEEEEEEEGDACLCDIVGVMSLRVDLD